MNVFLLIFIVCFLPPLVTFFLTKKAQSKILVLLVAICLPFVVIFAIDTSYSLMGQSASNTVQYGAPMDEVIYGIYGIPASIISIIVWLIFQNQKK
jgi:hypothetical protein